MSRTLKDLLATGAYDAPALGAPGRPPLDYRGLRAVIADTLATLNGLGIGRGDRVAIVLNNGPEMAACYMACASGVTSAPLNPAYRADEFEFYLSDLNAKALIVEAGTGVGKSLAYLVPAMAWVGHNAEGALVRIDFAERDPAVFPGRLPPRSTGSAPIAPRPG